MPDDSPWGWFVEWADYGDYGDASRPRSAGRPKVQREWFRTLDEANRHRAAVKAGKPGMLVTVRPSPGPGGAQRQQTPGLDLPPMDKRLT